MVGESLAIIAVIGVMAMMYLKSGRLAYAAMAMPLLCVPIAHLATTVIWGVPKENEGVGAVFAYRCGVLVAGLLIEIVGSALTSKKVEFKRGRISYILLSALFSVALIIAYILYLL